MDEDSTMDTLNLVVASAGNTEDPTTDHSGPKEGKASHEGSNTSIAQQSKTFSSTAVNHDADAGDLGYDSALSKRFLKVLDKETSQADKISIELAKEYALAWKEFAEEDPIAVYGTFVSNVSTILSTFSVPPDKIKPLRTDLGTTLKQHEKEREQKRQRTIGNEREHSFASIAFQIKDSDLTHTFDLEAFGEKVISVHADFYKNGDNKLGYVGPYFPFVQSSGMGKTKILYEYKRQCASMVPKGYKIEAKLILCRDKTTDDEERNRKESEIFDNFLPFDDVATEKTSAGELFDNIFKRLDGIFMEKRDETPMGEEAETQQRKKKMKILVLMFDEAHYLLDTLKIKENLIEAFWFRAIRLWICTKFKATHVVAVFTGTNTKIGNFKVESDKWSSNESPTESDKKLPSNFQLSQTESGNALSNKTDTRDYVNAGGERSFFSRGSKTFDPFFQINTIGCLRKRKKAESHSDYESAIPYGRPLFALMHQDKDRLSGGLATIVRRMLINHRHWETKKISSLISILGTRVQMGQTSIEIASDMVGSAYANLVGVDDSGDETAKTAFVPDPVCARLAMCLMDEDWKMEKAEVRGKAKSWWSQKVSQIFSQGICTPEKGDVGEILVALYFLFCADLLRKEADSEYRTFSVPMEYLIRLLVGGGCSVKSGLAPVDDETLKKGMNVGTRKSPRIGQKREQRGNELLNDRNPQQLSKKTKQVEEIPTALKQMPTITFSAVQVCRNYLRAYGKSWEDLRDEKFLERLYVMGIGFYVFAGCEMIDLVFPLKRADSKGNISFIPMVVSVKSHATYSAKSASTECKKMLGRAEEAGGCFFCLLVVFGSERDQTGDDLPLEDACMNKLIAGDHVAAVLRVPAKDKFGLSKAFRGCTSSKQEDNEIYASQVFLGAHRQDGRDLNAFTEEVLRSSPKKSLMKKTRNMHKAILDQE